MPRRWVLSAIKAPRYVPTMFGGGRLQHDQRPPGNVAADFEATNVPPETGQRAGAGYSFPGRREPGSQRFPAHPRLWPLAETFSVLVVGRGRTVTHKVRHFGRVCEWDQSRTPVEIPPRMLCHNFQHRREWRNDERSGNTDGDLYTLSARIRPSPSRVAVGFRNLRRTAAANPGSNRRLRPL